jgi:hypothetical protein
VHGVCVLLPEAESWLAQQEEIDLPRPRPQLVRKKTLALSPILQRERDFIEARMKRDRERPAWRMGPPDWKG